MAPPSSAALPPFPVRLLLLPSSVPRRTLCRTPNPNPRAIAFYSSPSPWARQRARLVPAASHICEQDRPTLDASSLAVGVSRSDDELRAAVGLRLRTFYEFSRWCDNEEYMKYLAKREFEALKERIEGKKTGFKKVCCINATLTLSPSIGSVDKLCSFCKFPANGKDRVVVGTLDLNQCPWLPDELAGKRPEDVGGNLTRAYLTNVCVAMELQRNGLGSILVSKSKKVACEWGITDLYAHVAVENEAALKLYQKCGFVYEDEEPAYEAKYLDRPRRYLLWADLHTKS